MAIKKTKKMANYIDFQFKVEGSREDLQKLQGLILNIEYEKDEYCFNLNHLMNGREGVLSKARFEELNLTEIDLEKFYILENFVNDFELINLNHKSLYDWHGDGRDGNLCMWNDGTWQRLSINENSIIFNGTAKWSPPIINIISGSKLFPDLTFRLSFHDSTDELHGWGAIEGKNGVFMEAILNRYLFDYCKNKKVCNDSSGNLYYEGETEFITDLSCIDIATDELYDHTDANYSICDYKNTKVIYNNINNSIVLNTSGENSIT